MQTLSCNNICMIGIKMAELKLKYLIRYTVFFVKISGNVIC